MTSSVKHHLLLALGVVSLSTAAILLRLYTGHPLSVVGWRLILATLFLTPWAVRRFGEVRALPRHSFWGLIGSGAALAAHFTLWVHSLRLTSVASAVTLVCLQPVFTMLGEVASGRKPPPRVLLPLALAIAGAAFMAGFDWTIGGQHLLGDLLALGGAGRAQLSAPTPGPSPGSPVSSSSAGRASSGRISSLARRAIFLSSCC